MAVISGSQGNCVLTGSGAYDSWDDVYAHIYAFTLNMGNDEYPADSFRTDAAGHVTAFGLWQATGTISAYLDNAAGSMPPMGVHAEGATSSTLTLTISTGDTYAFPAQLFDIKFAVNKQSGLNVLDCSFESTGDLTEVRA